MKGPAAWAIVLLLAGCMGQQENANPGGPPVETVPSGEQDSTGNPGPAAPTATIPLAWDGVWGTRYCAPTGTSSCGALVVCVPPACEEFEDTNTSWRQVMQGTPISALVNVQWAPTDTGHQTATVTLVMHRPMGSCGEGCTEASLVAQAEGTSPVKLAVDAIPWDDSFEALYISIFGSGAPTPAHPSAHVATKTPFTVEGHILVAEGP